MIKKEVLKKQQKHGALDFQQFPTKYVSDSDIRSHKFLVFREVILVINTGSDGPYLVTLLVDPNMF